MRLSRCPREAIHGKKIAGLRRQTASDMAGPGELAAESRRPVFTMPQVLTALWDCRDQSCGATKLSPPWLGTFWFPAISSGGARGREMAKRSMRRKGKISDPFQLLVQGVTDYAIY